MSEIQDLWGYGALDHNGLVNRLQFSVKSGCAVSPGTNDLTVQCDAGEVIHDGNSVSVAAQDNVALAAADGSNPRKDVVYVDGTGTLQVATGTAEAAKPSGQTHRDTYRPAPPDLSATAAVVLAEVWVPAGAVDIAAGDVSDRWLDADAAFQSVETGRSSVTEAFELPNTDNNPHRIRTFEESGPLNLKPHPRASNPVLTASDVSDLVNVDFVADPFIVYDSGLYHMFFEVYSDNNGDGTYEGDISHATSPDGLNWTYNQVVIDTTYHMSWPNVFKWQGTWYMPVSSENNDLRIFTADSFPTTWSLAETQTLANNVGDPIIIPWNDRWYLIAYDSATDTKHLYYSDTYPALLGGTWTEHPSSPIITTTTGARNGGRPIVRPGYVDVVYQDNDQTRTRLYRITDLTTSSFSQTEVTAPLTQQTHNGGWNSGRMHHVDAMLPFAGGPSIVAVDGATEAPGTSPTFEIGIYTGSTQAPSAFLAYPSNTNTGFSSGAWNTIPLDTLDSDVGGNVDTTNDYWTVPETGWYHLSASTNYASLPASDHTVRTRIYNITQSTGIAFSADSAVASAGTASSVVGSRIVYLTGGDQIRLDGYQDSGGTVNRQGGPQGTFLSAIRVR